MKYLGYFQDSVVYIFRIFRSLRLRKEKNMSILNIILLIIGIFIFVLGISWSKKNWINFFIKLLLLASGGYVAIYDLYLSGILIVLNK